ncbi:MAG: serine/threonine-protein kinase [Myxococcota bacterium]|nr:serine/threonine-protein kinase [Myxococcota bacterium]
MSQPDSLGKVGKYTLVKKLAQGGMAEVFLAAQEGPGGFHKQVVIKRILPHLADDKKFVEMFLDEARNAANFNNPNIVQIFDFGEADGSYFISMEYIDGYDLSTIIERAVELGKRVPPPIAARMIIDALSGLSYAHEFRDPQNGEPLNLVHRDISPQNILINRSGMAKLVDFGIAKARTSSNKTQTGAIKGKFSYMAPEQIAGDVLDGRCDIFAMGIVLYELLLGVRPFGEHSDLMAITAIINQAPRSPREIDQRFPPELELILNKALAKPRDERYASAYDMQRELELFLQQSGLIITNREVARYIDVLWSENPSLDIVGLGAAGTQDIRIDTLQRSATGPSVPAPAAQTPIPSQPVQQQQLGDFEPPPKAGNKGLMIALIVVVVLVLGGGGVFAFLLMQNEEGSSSGSAEASSDASAQTQEPDLSEQADIASGQAAGASQDLASTPELEQQPDSTEPSGDLSVIAQLDLPTLDTTDTDSGNTDLSSVAGDPDMIAVTQADISHIKVEELPGTDANVAPGFGTVKLKSNLKSKVYVKDETRPTGLLPLSLSFASGEHEIRLVGHKEKAEKRVKITVFDQRRYELEINFEKGTLVLDTDPGLSLSLDGKSLGKTPVEPIEVWEGEHEVELSGGGKSRKYSITIQPGRNERSIRF